MAAAREEAPIDFDAVSVVIPNLHSPVIARVLAGLHQQIWRPAGYEVLVVGLDRHGLVREGDGVRFISTGQPATPSQARNIGWRAAAHESIIFLDADAVPAPDWLMQMRDFVRAHLDAGAVMGGVTFKPGSYWTTSDQVGAFHEHFAFRPSAERPNLPSMNLWIPRALLERVGGFDESFRYPAGEDLDLTLRIRRLGYRLYLNTGAVVEHDTRRSSFRVLWQHGYRTGHESIRVRLRHRDLYRTPVWVERAWAWRLLAIPIALGKTAQVYSQLELWRYATSMPAIFLMKLAWCLGAADALQSGAARA